MDFHEVLSEAHSSLVYALVLCQVSRISFDYKLAKVGDKGGEKKVVVRAVLHHILFLNTVFYGEA